MYAMLTGCLPYTVDPFNITALHAKMLENKMNPIPSNLSPGRSYTLGHYTIERLSPFHLYLIRMNELVVNAALTQTCFSFSVSPFQSVQISCMDS